MPEMGTAEIELGRSRQHQRRLLEFELIAVVENGGIWVSSIAVIHNAAFELIQMPSFSTPAIELIQKSSFRTAAIARIKLMRLGLFSILPLLLVFSPLLTLCSGCAVRSDCSDPAPSSSSPVVVVLLVPPLR